MYTHRVSLLARASASTSPTLGAVSTRDELVGAVLAQRYKVIAPIGRGGMGTVYSGRHRATGRALAIKVLHPRYDDDRSVSERFEREARAASIIEHENIVNFIDIGRTDAGRLFLVMELLKGEDLRKTLVRERRLPWARVKTIAVQIARALGASHEKGVVHRDLKPENCFRVSRGDNPDFIKILDFGIAKISAPEIVGGRGETTAGTVLGTSRYMAPEQRLGIGVDPRVDIYALGVIVYQLLTGRLPIDGPDESRFVASLVSDEPLPIRQLAPEVVIPDALEAVVQRALAKRPEERFQSMVALEEALVACPVVETPRSFASTLKVAQEARVEPSSDTVAFASTVMMPPRVAPTPTPLATPQVVAEGGVAAEASLQRALAASRRPGCLLVFLGLLVALAVLGVLLADIYETERDTDPRVIVAKTRDLEGSTTGEDAVGEASLTGANSTGANSTGASPEIDALTAADEPDPPLPPDPTPVASSKRLKPRIFDWKSSVRDNCGDKSAVTRLEIIFHKSRQEVKKHAPIFPRDYNCVVDHLKMLRNQGKRLPRSGTYKVG